MEDIKIEIKFEAVATIAVPFYELNNDDYDLRDPKELDEAIADLIASLDDEQGRCPLAGCNGYLPGYSNSRLALANEIRKILVEQNHEQTKS